MWLLQVGHISMSMSQHYVTYKEDDIIYYNNFYLYNL